MSSEKGFTLTEVLALLAIVGILAAIAVPQYQNYHGGNPEALKEINADKA